MIKNTAALLLTATLAATGGALTTKRLLDEAPGAKTYRAHHFELDSSLLRDAGLDVRAKSWVTASMKQKDGGYSTVDLSNTGPCPMDKATSTCAEMLLRLGATEACR